MSFFIGYIRGGQTFYTKGHIGKKFEAEDGTDWKSKIKKVITTADVLLFSTQNQVKNEKKGYHVRRYPIFHSISVRSEVHISASGRGHHKMVSQAVVCPALGYMLFYLPLKPLVTLTNSSTQIRATSRAFDPSTSNCSKALFQQFASSITSGL